MSGMVRNGNDVDRQKKEWEYFSGGTKKASTVYKNYGRMGRKYKTRNDISAE